jgi:hypothetical protein
MTIKERINHMKIIEKVRKKLQKRRLF